jgi:rhodanese-related sulfurtransferase
MKSVDVNEIDNLDKNFVIDIRELDEYEYNSIDGLKHIMMGDLVEEPSKYIDKDNTYYIMCAAGGRSLRVCSYLEEQGYNVVNLEKGIGGYIKK